MVGVGRAPGRILGVESVDPVLSFLGALGLAQVAGTALVIDLCHDLSIHTSRTLADIAADGPSLADLSPGRTGVALLAAGGLGSGDCVVVLEALAPNWPAIVVRSGPGDWPGPTVPIRPLLPGLLRVHDHGPAVWQPIWAGGRPPGPGPVLPRLHGSLARRMLAGKVVTRAAWVRAWSPIWGMPWA